MLYMLVMIWELLEARQEFTAETAWITTRAVSAILIRIP